MIDLERPPRPVIGAIVALVVIAFSSALAYTIGGILIDLAVKLGMLGATP
jgi:hypothetical protein